MMKLIICLVLLLAATVYSKSLRYDRCDWEYGITTSFDLDGCKDGPYTCLVENGQNVSFTFGFKPESDESKPTAYIEFGYHDKQGADWMDPDLTPYHTNACPTTPCPIRKDMDNRLTFNTTIKASKFVSSGSVQRLILVIHIESKQQDVACSQVYLDMIK